MAIELISYATKPNGWRTATHFVQCPHSSNWKISEHTRLPQQRNWSEKEFIEQLSRSLWQIDSMHRRSFAIVGDCVQICTRSVVRCTWETQTIDAASQFRESEMADNGWHRLRMHTTCSASEMWLCDGIRAAHAEMDCSHWLVDSDSMSMADDHFGPFRMKNARQNCHMQMYRTKQCNCTKSIYHLHQMRCVTTATMFPTLRTHKSSRTSWKLPVSARDTRNTQGSAGGTRKRRRRRRRRRLHLNSHFIVLLWLFVVKLQRTFYATNGRTR